ncbi:eCIS core domain-containing protein [Chitinophaga vietnamensis]|uniref:eCIS core domain-containing protein n=1 Tax=Chitinophaga vietnamensis TaxID=2593957 RepID=UPI00117850FD|nr:DUF4157 domain-containing protein [Chitinophaga vietnamensis]
MNTSTAVPQKAAPITAATAERTGAPQEEELVTMLSSPFTIMPKLSVGAPDDPLEDEAERKADEVMRMPETTFVQRKCAHCEEEEKQAHTASFLQRKCAHCEEEEQVRLKPATSFLQRKEGGITASASATAQIQATKGRGDKLPANTQQFMESRFGSDFSDVRIHTASYATALSRELSAQAFTVGNDIYFNAGKFSPETASGKHLLAHELTHTIQQGGISRKINRVVDQEETMDILSGSAEESIQRTGDEEMSRSQEIAQSESSPGQAEVSMQPLSISIYNFAINSAQLKPYHIQVLNELILVLSQTNAQNWRVELVGNTDSSGEPVVNDPLSVRRAAAVRRYLSARLGSRISSRGEGEDNPAVSNETVSGRSRNRRVDMLLVSTVNAARQHLPGQPGQQDVPPSQDTPNRDPGPQPPVIPPGRRQPPVPPVPPGRRQPPATRDWDCSQTPILCGLGGGGLILIPILLCGAFWEACLCLALPSVCTLPPIIPVLPPGTQPPPPGTEDPKDPKDPKEQPKKPPRHACVSWALLPSGDLPMFTQWPFLMLQADAFDMLIGFRHDPEAGCDCACGEYQQNVKGYFETEYDDGRIVRARKLLTPGVYLDPTTYHEDGDGRANSEYGHRANPKRLQLDGFFPTQADGCYYYGLDAPKKSLTGFVPYENGEVRHTMNLEFEGGPVDRCSGTRVPIPGYWHHWTVKGETRKPSSPGTPGIPHTPPHSGGTPSSGTVVRATPRVTNAHSNTAYPSTYGGGLSAVATVGEHFQLRFFFRVNGRSELFEATIGVTVVAADDNTIRVVTDNNNTLNMAPDNAPPVLLDPHRSITFTREFLRNFGRRH